MSRSRRKRVRTGGPRRPGLGPRQPRADRPGDRQSDRQRAEIRRAGGSRGPPRRQSRSRHRGGASVGGSVVEVADHGPGIAPADRPRVFDRFVRLEGARSRPGSGLGLSLAAAVARLHGGAVRLEDNAPGLRVASLCRRRRAAASTRWPAPTGRVSAALGRIVAAPRLEAAPRAAAPGGLAQFRAAPFAGSLAELERRRTRDLLLGLADHSPYLWGLVREDPAGSPGCYAPAGASLDALVEALASRRDER